MAKENKKKFSEQEQKTLRSMFWNSGLVFSGFNQVKMEGNAFVNTMAPAINELYKDEEERKKALRRHNGFFNTHAVMFSLIAGLTYALEREKIEKNSVDDDTIENLKVALMGPTAGIGDAFFFNCIRVIVAGISIGFAAQGSILGALMFVLLYGGSQVVARWYLLRLGYSATTSFIDNVFESGLLSSLTKSSAIVGLTMVGAMVATTVKVNLNWIINVGGTSVVVNDVVESIMPGLLSVILVFVLMRLIKKGVKPITMVLVILVACVALAFVGVF